MVSQFDENSIGSKAFKERSFVTSAPLIYPQKPTTASSNVLLHNATSVPLWPQ